MFRIYRHEDHAGILGGKRIVVAELGSFEAAERYALDLGPLHYERDLDNEGCADFALAVRNSIALYSIEAVR